MLRNEEGGKGMTKSESQARQQDHIERRAFIKRGLFGGVILGLGALFSYQQSGYKIARETLETLKILNAKEFLVLESVAERIMSGDQAGVPSARELKVAQWIDGYLSRQPRWVQKDFVLLLNALEHSGPALNFVFSRFTRMTAQQQDAVLDSWSRSRLSLRKQGFGAVKGLCVMAYYRHPRSWDVLGYDGPLVKKRGG
jgi:hypothetical protein